jgi:hypothetical protein
VKQSQKSEVCTQRIGKRNHKNADTKRGNMERGSILGKKHHKCYSGNCHAHT